MRISIGELCVLCRLLGKRCKPPLVTVTWTISFGSFVVVFTGKDFAMKLPDDKSSTASIVFKDAKGFAAPVQGVPAWAIDPPDTVATMTVADDGMSASFAGVAPGTAQVSVTADADLGDGVVPLVVTGSIDVVSGQAVAGELQFSDPA